MIDQKTKRVVSRCSWLQGEGCGLKKFEMQSTKSEIHPSSPWFLAPLPRLASGDAGAGEDRNGDYGEWINSNDYNAEF